MARKSTLLIAGVALVAVVASAYIFAKDEITALVSPGAPSQQAQQRGGDAGGERSLPVIAEYATLMDEKTVVESVGTGKSALGVSIYPAVSGEVSDVLVRAGDKVTKGQVICIVEAMKLMNEIEAEVGGEVVDILVDDASPVNPGTPLILIN